jgi:uncharacterized protein (DUF849 family)
VDAPIPQIRRIKACLNGRRSRAEHPAVPVTPAEVAAAAAGAVAAGAEAVHVHPRGPEGAESLAAVDIAATVSAVRRACPGVPVGVSTGLWICAGDTSRRRDLVAGWAGLAPAQRPDFASVNLSEPAPAALAAGLEEAGVAVEAGIWSTVDVDLLHECGMRPSRVLVEVIDAPAMVAVRIADGILARLDWHGIAAPRLLHGEDAACWPMIQHAGRLGLPTRIGLEDTLVGPDGRPAEDNAALVRAALA